MKSDIIQNEQLNETDEELALRVLRAGLGYCAAKDPKELWNAISDAQRHQVSVTLHVPTVLVDYFRREGSKLGMTESELMVRILETHRFANARDQHLVRAIE